MDQNLSEEEGEDLLKLVRYGLLASQRKLCLFPRIRSTERLKENRGVFIGLWNDRELRGCIGAISPGKPLEESVLDLSIKSALKDPRFKPLCGEELPDLTLEVSILSPPFVTEISQIQIGVHGLVIIGEGKIGLLLPCVPLEYGWNVETFLEQTCLKGGLSKDAWRFGAIISSFTVQVFKGPALLG